MSRKAGIAAIAAGGWYARRRWLRYGSAAIVRLGWAGVNGSPMGLDAVLWSNYADFSRGDEDPPTDTLR